MRNHPSAAPVLVVGAGLAGLAAARELSARGVPYLLVEKEGRAGGLCRTAEKNGFRFDYTGHFLHFRHPETRAYVEALPGLRLKERRRHAAVRSEGVFTEYPYQENSAGLPASVARENVMGYLLAAARERNAGNAPAPRTFLELCLRSFGEGITRRFMAPYNAKLLKTPASRLSPAWMGRFIPRARVKEVVEGALRRRASSAGYNATFLYPMGEGIEALAKALARGLAPAACSLSLVSLDPARRVALFSDGSLRPYRALVSSAPLRSLARQTVGLPAPLRRCAARLRATSVYNINLGWLGGPRPPFSWAYFPESDTVFHRAGCLSACVRESAPPGGTSLYVEVSYTGRRPDPALLGKRVASSLRKLGWMERSPRGLTRLDLDLPGAYVVYDSAREEVVPSLLGYYERHGVFCVGRWGRWEYAGMETAIEQGREAARRLI